MTSSLDKGIPSFNPIVFHFWCKSFQVIEHIQYNIIVIYKRQTLAVISIIKDELVKYNLTGLSCVLKYCHQSNNSYLPRHLSFSSSEILPKILSDSYYKLKRQKGNALVAFLDMVQRTFSVFIAQVRELGGGGWVLWNALNIIEHNHRL